MATTKAPKLLTAISTTRKDALDLAQTVGQKKLLDLLRRAERELAQRLHQSAGLTGPGADSFTYTQAETALRQIRDITSRLSKGIKELVLAQGLDAADSATGNLLDYMQRANKTFKGVAESPLPLEEAGMLLEAKNGVESSILRRLGSGPTPEQPGILQRYGMATVEHFEEELAVGIATRKPWADIRDGLIQKSPFLQQSPASWAERIVRTETMGAFNRAGWEVMRAADDTLGDMVKILAATFDHRTGWDSYQVHGQIRRTDEAFAWAGGLFVHPPNRPNDREIVVPHRISWPIPSYLKWKSDNEVIARYYQQRKSGSPGPRPLMTTVPLEDFGKEQTKKSGNEKKSGDGGFGPVPSE